MFYFEEKPALVAGGAPAGGSSSRQSSEQGDLGCFFWELSGGEGKKLAEVWGCPKLCPKLPLGKHKCGWELELSRMHGKEGVGNHRGKFYALMGLK